MSLIKISERLAARIIIFIAKFIPKHKGINPKKGIIFCDLGIGDMIMFMPVIKALLDNGYDLTAKCERAEIIEILKGHFPELEFISPYKYEGNKRRFIGLNKSLKRYEFAFCVVNFHSAYKHVIKQIIQIRIPRTIGHSWKENKFESFWTDPIKFDVKGYEPYENLNLLKAFGINPDYYKYPMFFKSENYVYTDTANVSYR